MDLINIAQYVTALVLVLALGGAALLIKRYGNNPAALKAGLNLKNLKKWDFTAPTRRLALVETLPLGPRQRLMLVRRDNVEHLVLTGPEGSSVIESGIAAPRESAAP
jgi:flagellar protein FliO/FliZ